MVDLKVLVTGTGRCGTVFMSNVLTSIGWPCGHEAIFGPDGIEIAKEILWGDRRPENSAISRQGDVLSEGMDIVGDSSYMSAPFLNEIDSLVIHLVRNPMPVVASLIGGMFRNFEGVEPSDFEDAPDHIRYESFIYDNLPELRAEMPQLDRACLFYLRWNEMIESSGKVDIRHRVEDPIGKVLKLFAHEGGCYEDTRCNSFIDSSRRWTTSQIESAEIRCGIKDIMKRYGYTEPAPMA
jgi:hypothetical protein